MQRLQKFPEDHPLLIKLVGTGLCIAGAASAGALTIPALLGALGVQTALLSGASTAMGAAATGAAAQGSTVAGVVLAGAKVLFSTVAVDVGSKLMAVEPIPRRRFGGFLGRRRRSSTEPCVDALADLPLLASKSS